MNNFSFLQKCLVGFVFGVMAISKKLVVLNEEILVVISFTLFIISSFHIFSSNIEEAFLSRRDAMEKELNEAFINDCTYSLELFSYYSDRINRKRELGNVFDKVCTDLKISTEKASNELVISSIRETRECLSVLKNQEIIFEKELQNLMVSKFIQK
jgi:hypothetical protein